MEKGVYQQFYELEQEHWWFAGMRTICRELLKRLPIGNGSDGTRCLDVGCGTGLWTKELESFGPVCGLDLYREALDFCRKRGINRLVHATAENLPFKSHSFSLITAIGVIEHLDDDKCFLAELLRVCRPGGSVLLLTSAYEVLWSRHDEIVHHKRRYTNADLRRLLITSGFEIVQSTYVNTFLFPPILAVRLIQRLSSASAASQNGSPDVFKPASPINGILYSILWFEAKLMNFVSFPFGVGLLAITRKPVADQSI
jgi:ubiquinone/menaquinone biosynthesis C-methylase UbiE